MHPDNTDIAIYVDAYAAAEHLARIHDGSAPTDTRRDQWATRIRVWASRGHVRRCGKDNDGRTLYDLAELETHACGPACRPGETAVTFEIT